MINSSPTLSGGSIVQILGRVGAPAQSGSAARPAPSRPVVLAPGAVGTVTTSGRVVAPPGTAPKLAPAAPVPVRVVPAPVVPKITPVPAPLPVKVIPSRPTVMPIISAPIRPAPVAVPVKALPVSIQISAGKIVPAALPVRPAPAPAKAVPKPMPPSLTKYTNVPALGGAGGNMANLAAAIGDNLPGNNLGQTLGPTTVPNQGYPVLPANVGGAGGNLATFSPETAATPAPASPIPASPGASALPANAVTDTLRDPATTNIIKVAAIGVALWQIFK